MCALVLIYIKNFNINEQKVFCLIVILVLNVYLCIRKYFQITIKHLYIMLVIHVCFAPSFTCNKPQEVFESSLRKFYNEKFSRFVDSHFVVTHVSKHDTLVCMDLSPLYSMQFSLGVFGIVDSLQGLYIETLSYSC